jgi:hypothetical protein
MIFLILKSGMTGRYSPLDITPLLPGFLHRRWARGATRAWQAEAKLRAAGFVVYQDGKAVHKPSQCDSITP